MSTDYIGDRTATQSPSPMPTAGATIIIRLPVDGEAGAATIYQGFKTLADYVDFLMKGAGFIFDKTLKLLTSTPDFALNAGTVIDNTIDWRHRMLWLDIAYLGSAASPLSAITSGLTATPAASPATALRIAYFTGTGNGTVPLLGYIASGGVIIQCDASGNLRMARHTGHAAPIDTTNGDIIQVRIAASPQYT